MSGITLGELIIDASILFSFFNKSSARRKILKKLIDDGCKLFVPEYVLEELFNNKSNIIHFAKILESEFNELVEELDTDIITFLKERYIKFLKEANKISPHIKDAPYFALALALNCPIWSDEKAFKEQSRVKIFSTIDLINLFK